MQIIEYFKSNNQEYWKNEIGKCDWSAAKLLYSWLNENKLKQICGDSAEVYLLTDATKLVSFLVFAEQDEVPAPELSPWIGFAYTAPEYRGNHNLGKLIEYICDILKHNKVEKVYLSTEEIGLYEKYGFNFLKTATTKQNTTTRVYVRTL